MEEIYSKIVELVEAGRPSVLATIIRLSGSGPRGAGTKFLILEDGSSVGTIGGGILEARVREGARKVLETGLPRRFGMFLGGTDVAGTVMICGGDVEVFMEPISPGSPDHLDVFRRVEEIQRRGGSALLVTLLEEAWWQEWKVPRMLLQQGAETLGSILGKSGMEAALRREMGELLRRREPAFITYRDEGGDALELFIEPVTARPVLYVFGGGHVSMQISPLARRVGFKVVVVDDRAEFADPARWPEAEEVHQMPFAGALGRLPVDESSYLVIVTRGHTHDKTVLEQCLRSTARYVGMIGSRRKKALIYESLLQEGFTQADLDRVHAPIGLDIGAETPEEIAVSIVAELIQVRAGKREVKTVEVNYQSWLGEKWGERCVQALKSHGFDAHFAPSAEEARRFILERISGYESFGFGGSGTTRALGLPEAVKAMGKKVFDHWQGSPVGEESHRIRLGQGRCDCFLCSANAVSATGEIVNVDGVGNRTTAMTFGPKKIVIVAGMNKVRPDLESALRRVREVAAPMRAKSLNMDTPCAVTGICNDCNSPQRVCRVTTILHRRPMMSDISVVLVNENLGF